MNELSKIFGQQPGTQRFDEIRIAIASPDRILSWSFGEIKKPKPLTIGHLNPSAMDYFAHVFLVL